MKVLNRLSKVLGVKMPGNCRETLRSKSQKLFMECGLSRLNDGFYTLSPLLVRSLRKLENLVRKEMEEISAFEIILPSLTDYSLLKKSERLNIPEIFKVEEYNGRVYVLNPTCEESITDLMTSINKFSYRQLPCRFYQISSKFRKEKRARLGLLRSKEFIMKDLYCFDSDFKNSQIVYDEVKNIYSNLFQSLEVPYECVNGTQGNIGGIYSDEFHFPSEAGEDQLILCQNCGFNENMNCHGKFEEKCRKCQSNNIKVCNGIEVGHAFYLGTKYTEKFNATYLDMDMKPQLLHMSCFGLGLSRIIAAAVEVLCNDEQIRWPFSIAPYKMCIVPPKLGSKEEKAAGNLFDVIHQNQFEYFNGDVIVDDRTSMTVGRRMHSIKNLGFPYVIVMGKSIHQEPPCVEIHDIYMNSMNLVNISDINQFVHNLLLSKSNSSKIELKWSQNLN